MKETIYKLEKINEPGRQQTPKRMQRYAIGDIHTCQTQEEHEYLLKHFAHHWKDATEYPKIVTKPKSKKGAK